MEETMASSDKSLKRIILTGPECTGKSTLTIYLSNHYKTIYIAEYARDYVENLRGKYTYNDVVHIAQRQIELMNLYSQKDERLLFVDTYLIITKVWFIRVFAKIPEWIDAEIRKTRGDLYLLCKPDIPWYSDPVRENGGEMREILYHDYENELVKAGLNYAIVDGIGDKRIKNAITRVDDFLKKVGH